MKAKQVIRAACCVIGMMLAACATAPTTPGTVVAPAGPATAQLANDVTNHIAKTGDEMAADAAVLSKVAASAGAIHTINAGQPAGPRTDGVENEAKLIQAVAGEPSAADKLAASERARIVAEGKADEIAKAYATAQTAAAIAAKELGETKTALATSEAALAKANADAAAEQATLAAKLQAHEDALKKAADARVAKVQDEARKAWMAKINYVLLGLGGLFLIAAVANAFLTNGLGLGKSGILAVGSAVAFTLDYALNQTWFQYVVIGAVVVTIIGAGAWAYLEWKAHKALGAAEVVNDTAKKIVKQLDTTYEAATTEAKAVLDPVFDNLSKAMDKTEKNAVHLLRAEANIQPASPPAS